LLRKLPTYLPKEEEEEEKTRNQKQKIKVKLLINRHNNLIFAGFSNHRLDTITQHLKTSYRNYRNWTELQASQTLPSLILKCFSRSPLFTSQGAG